MSQVTTKRTPISAILFDMPSQKPTIERYCFGSCGKIIVGVIEIPMNDMALMALACREIQCPALDRQMEEPIGELPETGEPVYLRKLREDKCSGTSGARLP